MQDNPSFASPSRPNFRGDDETLVTASASPSKAPLRKDEAPATPTTATPNQGTPRRRPRGSSQSIMDSSVKTRTPTVRPGYRNSIYGNVAVQSKTPQARRARRSSSRDRTLEPAFEEREGGNTARSSLDSAFSRSTAAQLAPRPTSLPSPVPPSEPATRRPNGPLTLIEKHADLLAYIAQKEREVNDARKVYDRKLQELDEVKKRWEAITARQGFHSTTTRSSSTAKTGHQAPLPIRRTASNSSTGSTGSVSLQNGVLPLMIPPVNITSGTTTSSSSFGSAHPGQNASSAMVEGSRRLFGHLLDSLSDLTSSTAAEDIPSGICSSNGGEVNERKREKREMRTLSLIAGVGTTAKHAKNGVASGDRQARGSISPSHRMMSVASTSSDRSAELRTHRQPEASDQLVPVGETSASAAVDFTNIWDGLAPQARDLKEKLGSVMGVTAPT